MKSKSVKAAAATRGQPEHTEGAIAAQTDLIPVKAHTLDRVVVTNKRAWHTDPVPKSGYTAMAIFPVIIGGLALSAKVGVLGTIGSIAVNLGWGALAITLSIMLFHDGWPYGKNSSAPQAYSMEIVHKKIRVQRPGERAVNLNNNCPIMVDTTAKTLQQGKHKLTMPWLDVDSFAVKAVERGWIVVVDGKQWLPEVDSAA